MLISYPKFNTMNFLRNLVFRRGPAHASIGQPRYILTPGLIPQRMSQISASPQVDESNTHDRFQIESSNTSDRFQLDMSEIDMLEIMSLRHAFPYSYPRGNPQSLAPKVEGEKMTPEEISYGHDMAVKHSKCHFK